MDTAERLVMVVGAVVGVTLTLPSPASGATITAASCSAADVNLAISQAADGDEVVVPSGGTSPLCVWGSSTATVTINRAITVRGATVESFAVPNSTLPIAVGADPIITVGSGAAVQIEASRAVVRDLKMVTDANTPADASFISFSGSADEWVVAGMNLDQTAATLGYVLTLTATRTETGNSWGVIAGNVIMFDGEQVNSRGPCSSWDTDHTIGGAQNMFLEGNYLHMKPGGSVGYWDSNANMRIVERFNTLSGVYFDGHGSWSNYDQCQPERHPSVRHEEMYANKWDGEVAWVSMYVRGGGGVLFNNEVTNTEHGLIFLDEYYVRSGKLDSASWPYYPNACACKGDYPVVFQVGRGKNASAGPTTGAEQAAEPMFIWNNTKDGSSLEISNDPYGGPSQACKDFCNDQTLSVADFVQEGRDYYARQPQAGDWLDAYAPYQCPHPLTGLTGTCDLTTPGHDGYNIAAGGAGGSGGASGGAGGQGSAPGGGGAGQGGVAGGTPASADSDEGGCGCRLSPAGSPRTSMLALGVAVALWARRRRHR